MRSLCPLLTKDPTNLVTITARLHCKKSVTLSLKPGFNPIRRDLNIINLQNHPYNSGVQFSSFRAAQFVFMSSTEKDLQ